ncbi:metal ABC transporter solute-binding protein, Zn/Mn family [Alkalicoccobacillus porphyridii]|uniref:metal ABC transporter solute-binding protein, Zn/Mn family n=1 Tax=Alkalicoccobacillus porphyridii TaxID=2597270 RepID=UPI0021B0F42D|nr:zinc ABC transporter substrate-binding protein [Alkalicoccobacillus porphyridii]
MNTFKVVVGSVSCLALLAACQSDTTDGTENESIDIVTTIAQIADPLSVIGGEHINVTALMGPGVDPHLYEATQSDISTLQNADLIFYSGLHLEANMMDVFSNSSVPSVAISETIPEADLLLDEEGSIDPHVWFDPSLWMIALDEAVEEIKDAVPDHADEFEANKVAYFKELEEMQQQAEQTFANIPVEQRVLVTAHDAFGYFGRVNQLEVVALQGLSTESEIGLSDVQSTIDTIIEKEVPAVFVETSISDSSIRSVIDGAAKAGVEVELGGELYSDAMGEEGTEVGTYIGMYQHNVTTIAEALSK